MGKKRKREKAVYRSRTVKAPKGYSIRKVSTTHKKDECTVNFQKKSRKK